MERVALLESNLAEEAKLKAKSQSGPSGKTNDKKRKWDQVDGGKTSGGRPTCPKCGKNHPGECWKAMGACVQCGSMDRSSTKLVTTILTITSRYRVVVYFSLS